MPIGPSYIRHDRGNLGWCESITVTGASVRCYNTQGHLTVSMLRSPRIKTHRPGRRLGGALPRVRHASGCDAMTAKADSREHERLPDLEHNVLHVQNYVTAAPRQPRVGGALLRRASSSVTTITYSSMQTVISDALAHTISLLGYHRLTAGRSSTCDAVRISNHQGHHSVLVICSAI